MIPAKLHFQDKQVTYRTAGSGKAIVLLHGFLESAVIWEEYAEVLAKNYRVIAVDLPGHGDTAVFGETHTVALMAEVVQAVLEAENVAQASFIGHSMGGYVALAFANQFPEKTLSVGLFHSSVFADSSEKQAERDKVVKVLQRNPAIFIEEAIPNLFAKIHREKFAAEIEALKTLALRTPALGAIASVRGMKIRPDQSAWLSSVSLPVLLIAGRFDTTIPVEKSEEMFAMPKQGHTLMLDCGHVGFIEKKQEALDFIVRFLSVVNA